jgi:hypothetical protein
MDKDLQRVIDETLEYFVGKKIDILSGEEKYSKQEPGGEMAAVNCNESAFRIYNKTLCPDLWDSYQHLDPRVRVNLLRIAYDFYKKTKFSAPIVDVWLMGSIANYNWTPESDVDVHIIIDFSALKMPPETASKVAKSAGASWNKEHNITVKGHKVELNIQSAKAEKPYVTGIYSLVKDEWIKRPCPINPNINKPLIQQKYSEMKKYVGFAIQSGNREEMKKAKDYLDDYRQYGLDTGGELSVENIVYKILRYKGLVKLLKDTITKTYDKEMTVTEADKPITNVHDYIGGVVQGEVRAERVPPGKVKFYMHRDFPGLYSGQNNTNWRYKSDKKQVLWNLQPTEEDKEKVNVFLAKRGIINPTHKNMYTNEISEKDIKTNTYDKEMTVKETSGDISSEHFTAKFGDPRVGKNTAIIYLNNTEWFANAYRHPEINNQWIINRHTGAFKKGFPAENISFSTLEDLLKYMENWYIKYIPNESIIDEIKESGVDPKNVYVGFILPSLDVRGIRQDLVPNDTYGHEYLLDTQRDIDFDQSHSWRYRNDLNVVYWWNETPDEIIRDTLEGWIKKKVGRTNPKHKKLDSKDLLGFVTSKSDMQMAHGMSEGYGWVHSKDMKKDPLHIPGQRWRIKWYTKRKTPKMPKEE